MKTGIHPTYYPDAKVTCACGNTFTAGSTKPEIKVEICSKCHPFFTGEMRFVDVAGRVEQFKAKQTSSAGRHVVSKKQKKLLKRQEKEAAEEAKPRTLKEMMDQVKTTSN